MSLVNNIQHTAEVTNNVKTAMKTGDPRFDYNAAFEDAFYAGDMDLENVDWQEEAFDLAGIGADYIKDEATKTIVKEGLNIAEMLVNASSQAKKAKQKVDKSKKKADKLKKQEEKFAKKLNKKIQVSNQRIQKSQAKIQEAQEKIAKLNEAQQKEINDKIEEQKKEIEKQNEILNDPEKSKDEKLAALKTIKGCCKNIDKLLKEVNTAFQEAIEDTQSDAEKLNEDISSEQTNIESTQQELNNGIKSINSEIRNLQIEASSQQVAATNATMAAATLQAKQTAESIVGAGGLETEKISSLQQAASTYTQGSGELSNQANAIGTSTNQVDTVMQNAIGTTSSNIDGALSGVGTLSETADLAATRNTDANDIIDAEKTLESAEKVEEEIKAEAEANGEKVEEPKESKTEKSESNFNIGEMINSSLSTVSSMTNSFAQQGNSSLGLDIANSILGAFSQVDWSSAFGSSSTGSDYSTDGLTGSDSGSNWAAIAGAGTEVLTGILGAVFSKDTQTSSLIQAIGTPATQAFNTVASENGNNKPADGKARNVQVA